jgi:hypothetical protein
MAESAADEQHPESVVGPVAEAAGNAPVQLDQAVDRYLEPGVGGRAWAVGDMSLTDLRVVSGTGLVALAALLAEGGCEPAS